MQLKDISLKLESAEAVAEAPQNCQPQEKTDSEADALRKRKQQEKAEYDRQYRRKNKERLDALALRYRKNNKERINARGREWAQKNKERRNATQREWIKRNKERFLASQRKSRIKRREKIREWYVKNKIQHRASCKRWAENHKDKIRIYNKAHKAIRKIYKHKRRAYELAADIGCKEIAPLIKRWSAQKIFECYWCGKRCPQADMEIDHIIPISKGGKHSAENVCKSCRPCNRRKYNKLQSEPDYIGQMVLF